MLGETEIRRIVDVVLGASRADQTDVAVFANASALTRFANNYIHQNVEYTDVDVRVRAVIGQKIGIASGNEVSEEALRRLTARAFELAEHQRENEARQRARQRRHHAVAEIGPEHEEGAVGEIDDPRNAEDQ